jgi:hypothetical protein
MARAQILSHIMIYMLWGLDVSILNQFLGRNGPENPINEYSHAQSELLLCLSKRQVDAKVEEIWTPLLGSVEHQIARFISDGLLEEASLEEKLDCKYRVTDMKQLLEKHSIAAKGKKADLIKKFLDALPVDAVSAVVADVRLYRLTGKGKEFAQAYDLQKETDRKAMEQSAFSYLMNGDLGRAAERVALYEAQRIFPRGAGIDWSKGMPASYVKMAAYLLSYHYGELPLGESQRHEVGALLALSVLTGESHEQAGRRLLSLNNGEFSWAVFGNVLRTDPCCGFAAQCNADDPKAIAELYARTRMAEASVSHNLEALESSRIGKGIRILPANGDHCLTCNSKRHYLWSEIQDLPKLPKQWGCQCIYAVWI